MRAYDGSFSFWCKCHQITWYATLASLYHLWERHTQGWEGRLTIRGTRGDLYSSSKQTHLQESCAVEERDPVDPKQ